jgi:predicted transcriptional regulator
MQNSHRYGQIGREDQNLPKTVIFLFAPSVLQLAVSQMMGRKRTIIIEIGCDLEAVENVICLTEPRPPSEGSTIYVPRSAVHYIVGVEI